MAEKAIYPQGVRVFAKRDGAPDFVLCEIVISPRQLVDWLKGEGKDLLTDYKGEKQLKLTVKDGNKGPYAQVNTYTPKAKDGGASGSREEDDSLPF